MIENRFTEERLNKVQGYLNEIGAFKNESNEVFIDRFRKLVDYVRSIDEAQVPTDLNLIEVLKKAMKGEGQSGIQQRRNVSKPDDGYNLQVEAERV